MIKMSNPHRWLVPLFLVMTVFFCIYSCASTSPTVKEPGSKKHGIEESGRQFLVGSSPEGDFGMYTYILFARPPEPSERQRYLAVLDRFLNFSTVEEQLEYYEADSLNVIYLPVAEPADVEAPDSLLKIYNYTRANVIIKTLPEAHRYLSGPYLVSSLQPLTGANRIREPYMIQDLSTVPPNLIGTWVDEFYLESHYERTWSEETMKRVVLTLRTQIAKAAEGWEKAEKAVLHLITLYIPGGKF